MKINIILLAIIFLALIGILFMTSRVKDDKINYKNVILEVALVLLGFSLAIIWDNIKDAKREKIEGESLVKILQFEMANNHGVIENNLKIILANQEAMKEGKEKMSPLILLSTDAWESAKLRNNVFIENTGDLLKIVNLYTAIHISNDKISFRENYRIVNQAMSNYKERLKIIDNDVSHTLENTKGFLKVAQKFLHDEYPLVVKGYSFSFDNKGIIRKANENTDEDNVHQHE